MSTIPNPKNLKIAFGCQAGVGKSIAVRYLIDKYGGYEESFAGPIYSVMNHFQTVTWRKTEKDRKFLQMIGTYGRELDPEIWVNSLINGINMTDRDQFTNIFVSDLRFKNEYRALKENGFITVRIIRDNEKRLTKFGNGDRSHQSETELSAEPLEKWDYVIYNNSSIEEFEYEIEEMMKKINT